MPVIPKIPKQRPGLALRAYTAGLVDGEGSIQINPGVKGTKGVRYWYVTVQVSSVGVGFLERLREAWDVGTITHWKSRGSRPGRRITNWRVYSVQAAWMLKLLAPHLRLKAEQAQIVLDFRKCVAPKKNWLTPELLDRRRRLAEAMRDANARTGKATAATKGWGNNTV